MKNGFRDERLSTFGGTGTDLAEVFLLLRNAMSWIVNQDKDAWSILYKACDEIRKELKEVL